LDIALKNKTVAEKVEIIDKWETNKTSSRLSIAKQAELLNLNRSNIYYRKKVKEDDDKYKKLIKEVHESKIFYWVRKITKQLQKDWYQINRKRVVRLMREMWIRAVFPKPNTSKANKSHKKYPYLLRDLDLKEAETNQVWSTDITYIKIEWWFIYLTAVIDWKSRYVLSWEISNTLETTFCKLALEKALRKVKQIWIKKWLKWEELEKQKPEIFNTDQWSQFTSNEFIEILEENKIQISMDWKWRCLDNIFIERFWRTVKYEEIYLKEYNSIQEIYESLKKYFDFYNYERLHEWLDYKTPAEVYLN
jgi:putative transposase